MPSTARDIALLGVPIDSVGHGAGTEHGPVALREALADLDLADAGDTNQRLRGGERDPETGWMDFDDVVAMTAEVRARVRELVEDDKVPLVLGGCCTLLPAAVAGARDASGPVGLAFVDGHMDTYEGHTSPTGEGADMPVATLLGRAPDRLLAELGDGAVLDGAQIAMFGARDAEEAADVPPPGELGIADFHDREALRNADLAALGAEAAERLGSRGRFWLHLDVDVLGADVFPATDYLMPDGLNLDELGQLLTPLLRSPALAGANVACFNPEKDADASGAKALARLIGSALEGRA